MLWGWSLALEEQFYLSVPLLFFGLSKMRSDRARLALLGAFWLSALVVRLTLFKRHPEWDAGQAYDNLYFKTHTRFDTLVAGGCLGLAIKAQIRAIAETTVVLGKSREIATHRAAAMQCVALGPAPGVGGAARADQRGRPPGISCVVEPSGPESRSRRGVSRGVAVVARFGAGPGRSRVAPGDGVRRPRCDPRHSEPGGPKRWGRAGPARLATRRGTGR